MYRELHQGSRAICLTKEEVVQLKTSYDRAVPVLAEIGRIMRDMQVSRVALFRDGERMGDAETTFVGPGAVIYWKRG